MFMIKVVDLTKKYRNRTIINNLNYSFSNEHIYFMTSINGSGKTTFFKCLLRETSFNGNIYDDKLIYQYLPEKVLLPSFIKVYDFLASFTKLYNDVIDDTKIDYLLKLFRITKYKYSYLNYLSKGTKQKVLIIKTLLSDADVYLFDEPLSGLDKESRILFMDELKLLQETGKLIIIATHYYNDYNYPNKVVLGV